MPFGATHTYVAHVREYPLSQGLACLQAHRAENNGNVVAGQDDQPNQF